MKPIIALLTVLALAACGGSEDSAFTKGQIGSCLMGTVCIDYTGGDFDPELAQAECEGTWQACGCPMEEVLIICTRARGFGNELSYFYYVGHPVDAATLRDVCSADKGLPYVP